MQRKQLVIAALCSVVAVLAVFAYTASIGSEAQRSRQAAIAAYGGEQATVMVASATLQAGHEISDSDIVSATWLTDLLPQSEVATSADQAVGLVVEEEIKEGEVIVLDRIGEGNARINVPNGLEAVSIASDDVLAVGGAIRAGSFVDVYAETSSETVTLLGEGILVLETSAVVEEGDSSEAVTWVTLAVTPESVSDLISASAKGTIHLVLPASQS